MLVLRIAAVVDAARTVKRSPGTSAPWLRTLVAGLAIVGVGIAQQTAIRSALVSQKVPSASMVPTLVVGDHFFVNRLRHVRRGDVVVFPFPARPTDSFVKRVVGMPGETISFRSGHPVIGGVEVPSCRLGEAGYKDLNETEHYGDVYLERLGGHTYLTFYDQIAGRHEDQGPYSVLPGQLFVVGDNRWNAHDSRMWNGGAGGGVPIGSVVGVAIVVWLSATESFDWSRVGMDVEVPRLPGAMSNLQPVLEECAAKLGALKVR